MALAFVQSLQRLRRHPLGSLLSLLQIIAGALVMTLALCIYLEQLGQASEEQEFFYVVSGYRDAVTGDRWFARIRPEDMKTFLKLAPAVKGLAIMDFSLPRQRVAVVNGKRYAIRASAVVGPNYFNLLDMTPAQGSFFTPREQKQGKKVVVISERAAAALYPGQNPIGQVLGLMPPFMQPGGGPYTPELYRVVGTFDGSSLNLEDSLGSPPLYLPYWASGSARPGRFVTAHLLARAKPGRGQQARHQLLEAVKQTYKGDYGEWILYKDLITRNGGFYIQEFESALGLQPRISLNNVLFALFGVVTLIVSAIGVFSNTVTDMAERGHEIGLRRAIGASSRRIARGVMGETALLTAVGSLLGVALAALVISTLSSRLESQLFSGIGLHFEPLAGLAVLVVQVLVSAGLGVIPALQIGRLKPAEALRET